MKRNQFSSAGIAAALFVLLPLSKLAAQAEQVSLVPDRSNSKINVVIGKKLFTTFMFPDTLEKPVLYPVYDAAGTMVSRGFPFKPLPGEPTDHPHHMGIWFNYENVNGLDFWNNSYAIPAEKKSQYGWIKTDRITRKEDGKVGVLSYHANWTNQKNDVLLEENTRFEFSGTANERIIDRTTILTANTEVSLTDAKDGMLGFRMAHELQIPTMKEQKYTDDKGNVTVVKASADSVANGNYITSAGKMGDDAWSTRGVWCKAYAKMGNDSVSIVIIDHPGNPNYPTFWHARGYGLFAANPLGEKIFTNGKSEKNLKLKKGESVQFTFRIVINNGAKTPTNEELNKMAKAFGSKKMVAP